MGTTVNYEHTLGSKVRHKIHDLTGVVVDLSTNRGGANWALLEYLADGAVKARWFSEPEIEAVAPHVGEVRSLTSEPPPAAPHDSRPACS